MNFWKDGISIDEGRVSTIMISFLITLGFIFYDFIHNGSVNVGLLSLTQWLITAIAGINVASSFANRIGNIGIRSNEIVQNYQNTDNSAPKL